MTSTVVMGPAAVHPAHDPRALPPRIPPSRSPAHTRAGLNFAELSNSDQP